MDDCRRAGAGLWTDDDDSRTELMGVGWTVARGWICCRKGVLLVESKADAGSGQIAHVRLLVVRDAGCGAIVPGCRCICYGG
ncbi:hypothetical protein ACLOJK_027285 [Asimina triloba]